MTAISVPRSDPVEVFDDLLRRVADLERRMRVRGDVRLKLAPDRPAGTMSEFLTVNYTLGGDCTPVPGGTLRHIGTTDNVEDEVGSETNELNYTNGFDYSASLATWLTRGGCRWTAVQDCLVFASLTVQVSNTNNDETTKSCGIFYGDIGGTINSLGLGASGPAGWPAGATVVALTAGDVIGPWATTDGTGTHQYSAMEWTVLVVCSPGEQEAPPG